MSGYFRPLELGTDHSSKPHKPPLAGTTTLHNHSRAVRAGELTLPDGETFSHTIAMNLFYSKNNINLISLRSRDPNSTSWGSWIPCGQFPGKYVESGIATEHDCDCSIGLCLSVSDLSWVSENEKPARETLEASALRTAFKMLPDSVDFTPDHGWTDEATSFWHNNIWKENPYKKEGVCPVYDIEDTLLTSRPLHPEDHPLVIKGSINLGIRPIIQAEHGASKPLSDKEPIAYHGEEEISIGFWPYIEIKVKDPSKLTRHQPSLLPSLLP